MNIIKSFNNLFSYSISEPQVLTADIEDIHKNDHKEYKDNGIFNSLMENIADEFENNIDNFHTINDIDKFKKNIQKKYKYTISNSEFIKIYKYLNLENQQLRNLITKKKCKSNSGVLVITILTSAHPKYIDEDGEVKTARFSCKHDCAYCPNEPAHEGNNWVAQPRSYLYSEPAVLRANANDFDPIKQMNSRITSLINMGHIPDKLEVIVLGGTWSEYPRNYQDSFITDMYYSANIYFDNEQKRSKKTLEEEIEINETSKIHIIGLTLLPDGRRCAGACAPRPCFAAVMGQLCDGAEPRRGLSPGGMGSRAER
jgi:histone acetyltransferase (RNA polymerase elongator complex component)